MESSDRERQENARRERVDVGADAEYSASVEQGHLPGTDTSVRARWRVDVIGRNGDSASGTPEPPADGTILVRVRLRNPAPTAQRVSVRNALDGPVLFPRRRGVPEAGWTRSGFVGVVDAESERALGYACPAPIRTPPIELGRVGEHDIGDRSDGASESAAPAAVVRTHGDAAPPAAVAREVARSAGGRAADETAPQAADDGGVSRELEAVETASEEVETESEAVETTPEPDTAKTEADPTAPDRGAESAPPPAVTTWLDEIENRVARAERLDDAEVTAATAALTETAGLEPALDDAARLSNDAAELRELAARASELADRAGAVEVSETALRRLA